jgi:glycosyltransferase involved in cell wall biosynthesis/SAM-dependent methyltransferase
MTAAVYFDQSQLWGNLPDPYQVQVCADIISLLPPDAASVLDVGCGDGAITNMLPAHLKVVGLDPSPAALKHVRRESRCGTITDIPFADKSFDLVMTTDVCEHLPPDELAKAIREMTRVARRHVVICVPHKEQWLANFTRCRNCGHTYHINHHQRSWDEESLVNGLLPEPWKVNEVRYSGVYRPHDDPTIDLRHRLGIWFAWNGAVCTQCGSKEQVVPDTFQEKLRSYLDCLCANQWWSADDAPARFTDRSEIMVLYSRGEPAPRLYAPGEPVVAQDSPYAIDFTNALQRATGWTIGPRWPKWLAMPEHLPCAEGIRVQREEYFAKEVPLRFPIQALPGDDLVVEVTTFDPESLLFVQAWDYLNQQRVLVEESRVGPGRQSIRFTMNDKICDTFVDSYGFLFILSILGNVVVHRAEYQPRSPSRGAKVPWVQLGPGHQVFSQRAAGYTRSWGYTALEPGRLPLPRDLCDEAPREAARRAEDDLAASLPNTPQGELKKRAEQLLFHVEQMSQPKAVAATPAVGGGDLHLLVKNYLKVLHQRDQRVLVLSHLYPSRQIPSLGPFVHEQVSALRVNSSLDVRVVCCVPLWMNTFNPAKIARAYHVYLRMFDQLRWETHDGVPVLYLPYIVGGFFRFWLHGKTYENAVAKAAGWIKQTFDFQVIHAHTSYLDGSAARAVGDRFNVPYVITEHTGPFSALTENRVIRSRTVRALAGARKVFCVSEALAKQVRAVVPAAMHDKIVPLGNGVDTTRFFPPLHSAPDPLRPRLLSVISFDDNKNPFLLLEAFRRLRAEIPGATLAIAGQGPLRDAVATKIHLDGLSSAVTLLGFKSRPEVARLMREKCDLFVLTSNTETFGVVLIEALASGKPVVSTDSGGPRDIVTDSSLGLMCPPDNVEALHAALSEVTRNLARYDAARIRQHAVTRFDYYNLAARLVDEYEQLIAPPLE